VSQIKRKVSCFSFSADEKSREQVVNQIPPGHGIDMPNQTAQGMPINHDHRFDSGNGLFPADQITSDINIIKSLRHQDALKIKKKNELDFYYSRLASCNRYSRKRS
jgi:hypothetical protein